MEKHIKSKMEEGEEKKKEECRQEVFSASSRIQRTPPIAKKDAKGSEGMSGKEEETGGSVKEVVEGVLEGEEEIGEGTKNVEMEPEPKEQRLIRWVDVKEGNSRKGDGGERESEGEESGSRKRQKEETPEKREIKKNRVEEEDLELKRVTLVERVMDLLDIEIEAARKSKKGVQGLTKIREMVDEIRKITGLEGVRERERDLARKVERNTEVLIEVVDEVRRIGEMVSEKDIGERREDVSEVLKVVRAIGERADVNEEEGRRRVPSYAEMTRAGGRGGYASKKKEYITVIYPEKEDLPKCSKSTRGIVETLIDPAKEGIGVVGVHEARYGGVVLRMKDEESMQRVLGKESLKNAGFEVRRPNRRNPLVIIKGIPESMKEEEFLERLYVQNLRDEEKVKMEDMKGRCKFKFKKGRRDREDCCWVIEVDVEMRRMLVGRGRVFLNWGSHVVEDFYDITRCAKCMSYGHIAKFCKEEKVTCGHCSEKGHTRITCEKMKGPPKCGNCDKVNRRSDHEASSRDCPAYKYAVERAQRAIQDD